MSEFLPKGYSLPKQSGNYTKLEKGKTKLRILSHPIVGWEDWKEEDGKKTPLRFRYENKPEPINPERPVKHFWAFKVWNYNDERVQVFQITQSTIQGALMALLEDDAWGSPTGYDITITRVGDGMETKYSLVPTPPKELPEGIKEKSDSVKVDLEKLFAGLDPFGFEPTSKRESEIGENGEVPVIQVEEDDIKLEDIPF